MSIRIGILISTFALVAGACASAGSSTSSGTVSAIGLSPNPCVLGRTKTQQMSATATLNNGTKRDLGGVAGAVWSSADLGTATVSPEGVVVGVNTGSTAITLTFQGATGNLDCTVVP